jgi:hypothetical protein
VAVTLAGPMFENAGQTAIIELTARN